MASRLLPGLDEQRQADEIDGGGDGQRPDESQHQAHQSGEAEDQLEQGGNQDGSLDLWTTRRPSQAQDQICSFVLGFQSPDQSGPWYRFLSVTLKSMMLSKSG